MMNRFPAPLAILLLSFNPFLISVAQDNGPALPGAEENFPPPPPEVVDPEETDGDDDDMVSESTQAVRALRAVFVNGIVESFNSFVRANVRFEWELLPESDPLDDLIREYAPRSASIKIPNRMLLDAPDINSGGERDDFFRDLIRRKASKRDRDILLRAFPFKANNEAFESRWILRKIDTETERMTASKEAQGLLRAMLASAGRQGFQASEYYSLLRDQNVFKAFLMSSKGAILSYKLPGVPELDTSQFIEDDLTWEVKVYEFTVSQDPDLTYYRYTVRAISDIIPLKIPISSLKPVEREEEAMGEEGEEKEEEMAVEVEARIDLVRSRGSAVDIEEALSLQSEAQIKTVLPDDTPQPEKLDESSTRIEEVLRIAGGAPLGTLIPRGILGGSQDTSLISGGLIDFGDDEIDPFIGFNQELTSDGSLVPGILFGVGVDDDSTPLFIGPSLRFSAFTLSAGTSISDRADPLAVNFAAVFSVDLTLLTRNKKTTNTVPITSGSELGGLYRPSDEIAQDLALLEWEINITGTKPEDSIVFARRICDRDGQPVSTGERVDLLTESNIRFAPVGFYVYGFDTSQAMSFEIVDGVKIPTKKLDRDYFDISQSNLRIIDEITIPSYQEVSFLERSALEAKCKEIRDIKGL